MEAARVASRTPAPADPAVASRRELGRMREAARDFEAILLQQMLTALRRASGDGKALLSGTGNKLYQGLMDEELARSLARGGGLGLADMLVRELTRRNPSSPPAEGSMDRDVGRVTSEGDAR
jgi:flagellar protein FlgJ